MDQVQQALDDVVEQIVEGAKPLGVSEVVRQAFREKYRPSFEDLENQAAWPDDKPRVLILARIVGNLAAFLTTSRATLNQMPAPGEVDEDCADAAGWLVSRTICPPPHAQVIAGRHCKDYRLTNAGGPALELAASVVRQALKALLPAPRSGPLAP